MAMDAEVLASLDFPIRCNGCRHPVDGHTGDLLDCSAPDCRCSRRNPGGRNGEHS